MDHHRVCSKTSSCENCTVCSFSARMHSWKSCCEAGWARTSEASRNAARHTRVALSESVQGFLERNPHTIEFFTGTGAKVRALVTNGRARCAAAYVSVEPTLNSRFEVLKKFLVENPYTTTLLCAVLLTFAIVWCIVPAIVIVSEILFNIPPLVIFSGVFFLIWIPFYVWISSKNEGNVDDQVQQSSLTEDPEMGKPPDYETVAPPPYEDVTRDHQDQDPDLERGEDAALNVASVSVPLCEVHPSTPQPRKVTLTM